ncbi:SGNH/GDSL hydrolase family protein [Actinoallomurus iriomotensis]|uniref:SGNH/GDSL hydrolase family protein n=1 Tax=Actinoallomurus iriomotensis TaxID=478107 RepID=UPI0025564808|nr:GDSL-type esterase/lipase family protein [Actinoallomurus iriomotensis]
MRRTRRGRTPIAVAVGVLLAAALGVTGSASADGGSRGGDWFTSWAQSQQGLAGTTLNDQSVRMITHLSQGGDALRVRVQNQFGTAPLTVDAVAVAVSGTGAAIVGGSRPATFPGPNHRSTGSVTVAPGGEAWSDPIRIETRPQDDIAVSMYVAGQATPGVHASALRDNYVTEAGAGDHVGDASGAAYTRKVGSTYLVSAVDVHNTHLRGTIVAYGSSVVDGTGSTNCGPGCTVTGDNRRWTDELARRVVKELPARRQVAIANAGIGGTTSSPECANEPAGVRGLEGTARLDRDVLALHGVTAVIYYYGTNDLQDDCTADQILRSYDTVFARLRQAGIKVYVTPITARPIYTDQMNLHRYTVDGFVHRWNDCSGHCDEVLDFDQVIKDPLHPNAINPSYDNGDGIHANIAGQQAIADSISLPLLARSATTT